jgi:protein-S-isoprenylcysteine O-methyltransferase Ste14
MSPWSALAWIWLLWYVSWLAVAWWADRAVARPPRRAEFRYRIFTVVGVILLFGPIRYNGRAEIVLWATPPAIEWALVVTAAAGFAFAWWARLHLGRLWSGTVGRKANHRVIDTGPYGLVRHPIYTGITLASLATAVMRGTVEAWAGFALLTIGWVIKARLEEGFLRTELGAEAYDAYASRTPMLIPFLR